MTPPRRLLDQEEALVRRLLIEMAAAADRAIADAMRAFQAHDLALAQQVVDGDREVNQLQKKIEDECITTMARQQPMATDLRKLVSDINIATELERIADHGADIAKIVLQIDSAPQLAFAQALEGLASQARDMLSMVMTAYANGDRKAALEIAARDDGIDVAEDELVTKLFDHMAQQPQDALICAKTMWIAHNLERVGDRATNIAERIAYIATGESLKLNS